MAERANFNALQVKGHCKIELHDAETGELTDTQEGDNFLSYGLLNALLKQIQKALFVGQCPNAGLGFPAIGDASGQTNSYNGLFRYLVLTDSTLPEDSATENSIPGNVLGWANRTAYSGTDPLIGTINATETFATEKLVHWVFDFGTDKANGTINSVCWVYTYPEVIGSLMITTNIAGSNIAFIASLPRVYLGTAVVYGDGYFWALFLANSVYTLYKINPTTFQEVASYVIAGASSYSYPFVILNGYMYFLDSSSKVRRLKLSDLTYTQSTSTYSGYAVVATDGIYLYTSFLNSSSTTVYQIRISDLVTQTSKSFSPGYILSMFFLNSILYIASDSSTTTNKGLYTWDYANNLATKISPVRLAGIFSDGANVYKSYSETFLYGSTGVSSRTQLASIASITDLETYNLMARKLLASPVVKTNSKTMKIIYEFILA